MVFLDLTIPRLSFYEFEKFLFLPTIIVVSMIQKLKSNGRISLYGLRWSKDPVGVMLLFFIPEFGIFLQCSQKNKFSGRNFLNLHTVIEQR